MKKILISLAMLTLFVNILFAQVTAVDGTDVRLNTSSIYPQTEPHISINKTDPNNILVSINSDPGAYVNGHNNSAQGYYYSQDGGSTWSGSDFLPNESTSYGLGDPSTCFDAQGYGYLGTMFPTLGYSPDPPVWYYPVGYGVQKTTNEGVSWQGQVMTGNSMQTASFPYYDKGMLTADDVPTSPYVNNLYAVWTEFSSFSPDNGYVKLIESRDGLATFQSPITLRNNTGFGFGANVQTGPAGQVYVCWAEYGTSYPASSIKFTVSTDDWATHTTSTAFTYTGINAGSTLHDANSFLNNIASIDYAAMAVDKSCGANNGRIYIAYAENINTLGSFDSRIKVRYSDDNGSTWSTATIVNIATGRQNFMPWIAVDDASGLVCVAYYSLDCNCSYGDPNYFSTNTYLAYSSDGGGTWANQKVSDVSFTTARLPGWANNYMGDYIGVTAYGGNAYVAWMDNRIGTTTAAQVQTYVSRVAFNAPIIHSKVNDINITGPVTINSGQQVVYQSGGSITAPTSSTYTISSGADVTMKATNSVILQPGFQAADKLYAYIDVFTACTNHTPYRKAVSPDVSLDNTFGSSNLDFSVYPNPTSDMFHLRINNKTAVKRTVTITDMLGKIVWLSEDSLNEEFNIDISEQPAGFYFVKVRQDGNVTTKKIIRM